MMKNFTLAISCAALISCSSAPVTSYYQLSPVAVATTAKLSAAEQHTRRIYLEPVQVASYLNGRGLVLQLSDVELEMARQHVWAEPLQQQLQRQIRDLLGPHGAGYTLVSQPDANTVTVQLHFDRFHAIEKSGEAVVAGYFFLQNSNQPTRTFPFHIQTPLEQDGYASMVKALSVALQQLTAQIEKALD